MLKRSIRSAAGISASEPSPHLSSRYASRACRTGERSGGGGGGGGAGGAPSSPSASAASAWGAERGLQGGEPLGVDGRGRPLLRLLLLTVGLGSEPVRLLLVPLADEP